MYNCRTTLPNIEHNVIRMTRSDWFVKKPVPVRTAGANSRAARIRVQTLKKNGGHFVLAASAMVAAWWMLVHAKAETLFLEDAHTNGEMAENKSDDNNEKMLVEDASGEGGVLGHKHT